MSDAACACTQAIDNLHEFFAAWYRGEESAHLHTLEAALADDFRLITPDAAIVDRTAIVAGTAAKRGAWQGAHIRIVPRVCTQLRGVHLSTYEEWHADDVEQPGRLSTAMLTRDDDAWLWHVVHETWIVAPDDVVG